MRRPPKRVRRKTCLSRSPPSVFVGGVQDKRGPSLKGSTPLVRPELKFGTSESRRLNDVFGRYRKIISKIQTLALSLKPSDCCSRSVALMAYNFCTVKLPSSPSGLKEARRSAFFRKPDVDCNPMLWRIFVKQRRIPDPLIEEMVRLKAQRTTSLQLKRAVRGSSGSASVYGIMSWRLDEVDSVPFGRSRGSSSSLASLQGVDW